MEIEDQEIVKPSAKPPELYCFGPQNWFQVNPNWVYSNLLTVVMEMFSNRQCCKNLP
jgi:hypothetical protein